MIIKKGTAVVSSQDKTVTVLCHESRLHSKYQKRFTVPRKFLVHDEKNEAQVGDTVTFQQAPRHSKRKAWAVVSVTSQQS